MCLEYMYCGSLSTSLVAASIRPGSDSRRNEVNADTVFELRELARELALLNLESLCTLALEAPMVAAARANKIGNDSRLEVADSTILISCFKRAATIPGIVYSGSALGFGCPDLIFNVGSTQVLCHRAVLSSCSEYFNHLFAEFDKDDDGKSLRLSTADGSRNDNDPLHPGE